MSERKLRVTLTLDRDLLEAAGLAVRAGESRSISSWVNQALSDRADHDRRQKALGEALAAHEAEFGEITDAEMERTMRGLRAKAIKVRAAPPKRRGPRVATSAKRRTGAARRA